MPCEVLVAHVSIHVPWIHRKNYDFKYHPLFNCTDQHDIIIFSLVFISILTCGNEKISETISAGPFCGRDEMQWILGVLD